MKINDKKKIYYLFLLTLFMVGCCWIPHQADRTPYRVVTHVRIIYQNGTMQTQRDFYQEENIRQILDYLRYIDPYGLPKEDPMTAENRTYFITVIYSDGSECLYEQRADMYFRSQGGTWKRIEPHKAQYLSGLYGMMPSDQPLPDEPVLPLIRPQI